MAGNKAETVRGRSRGIVIQDRDRDLLRQLFVMHVADRNQIMAAAGFHSITRVNTRLLALHRVGLLRRFFIGYGWAHKALYALSLKGAQLIGVPLRGPRRRQDAVLAADFSVLHQLAINDVYCNVSFAPIPIPVVQFVNWIGFTEPISEKSNLIPDGYFELRTTEGIDSSFLEVDLGNESMEELKDKAKRYLKLATSEEFQRKFQHSRFRVLVLADSARRLKFIRAAIAHITEKLFFFATLEETRGEQFFGSVWLRSKGTQLQSFLEYPR